jgi:hypothetical protein
MDEMLAASEVNNPYFGREADRMREGLYAPMKEL